MKGCVGKGILYRRYRQHRIEVYADTDWVGSLTDRRFTSMYCSFVGGNLVRWRNKKQFVVFRLTVEAEFRYMAHGICEMLWLEMLLAEVGFPIMWPIRFYCDNKKAIIMADDPVQHDWTKHVEVDRHFIDHLKKKNICMPLLTN